MDMSANAAVISVLGFGLLGLLGYFLQALRADIRRGDGRIDRLEVAHREDTQAIRKDMAAMATAHREDMATLMAAHREDMAAMATAHREDMKEIRNAVAALATAHREDMKEIRETLGEIKEILASHTATLATHGKQLERMMDHGERIAALEGTFAVAS